MKLTFDRVRVAATLVDRKSRFGDGVFQSFRDWAISPSAEEVLGPATSAYLRDAASEEVWRQLRTALEPSMDTLFSTVLQHAGTSVDDLQQDPASVPQPPGGMPEPSMPDPGGMPDPNMTVPEGL